MLNEKTTLINQLNDQIVAICKVEEIEKEIEEAEELKIPVKDSRADISDIMKATPLQTTNVNLRASPAETTMPNLVHDSVQVQEIPPMSSGSSEGIPSVNHFSPDQSVKAKLLKLTLRRFRGEIMNWISFWDSYNSVVHSNTVLSKIDEFNYLNSILEGAAKRAIQGLTLSDANYDSAVEILQQRFGRTQQIISAHMDDILKIPPSTSDQPSSLRFVNDKISVHVRGLKDLGVSSEQYGSLLIPIVMSKLPNDIRLQIARNATDEFWKIEELLKTIKVEIEARDASEGVKTHDGRKPQSSNAKPPITPTTNALYSKDTGKFHIRCAYCNGEHYWASCTEVK